MKRFRFLIGVITSFMAMFSSYAQENYNTAQYAPQQKETILSKSTRTQKAYDSLQSAYKASLREASQTFPNREIGIRNLKKGDVKVNSDGSISNYYNYTIVALPTVVEQRIMHGIKKATRQIEEGNRFALDKITILDGNTDKEKTKSLIVDLLLESGYKVVAKEHLEKLYNEQKGQESGIYNPKTTVESNNFSAVGYFVSVRITDEYVQVQVVNVSTGEYESNLTENI